MMIRSCLILAGLLIAILPASGNQVPQTRNNIEQTVRQMTSPEFQGRSFRSEGGRKAAEYLAERFREAGLASPPGVTNHLQPIDGGGQNVIGLIEAAGARDEYLIVSAQYDSFGAPFVGAADNAAGVAVMIEIARLASAQRLPRRIIFIAFDGGEQGRAGAEFYAGHPVMPLEKTVATISLHNFGRGTSDYLKEKIHLYGAEWSAQVREVLKNGPPDLMLFGVDTLDPLEREHFDLSGRKIPYLLATNGPHYTAHNPQDVPGRLDFAALVGHVESLSRLLREMARFEGRFEWSNEPVYDPREAANRELMLKALRQAVIDAPGNRAGLERLDEIALELRRFRDRPIRDPKAREAVVLRAARAGRLIASPNAVEYEDLKARARVHEARGETAQLRATLERLLKLIESEYRRGDREIEELRGRLRALGN
ncbi:MAG: M28 family metallopeptidase [Blastocatellales bacterium]